MKQGLDPHRAARPVRPRWRSDGGAMSSAVVRQTTPYRPATAVETMDPILVSVWLKAGAGRDS